MLTLMSRLTPALDFGAYLLCDEHRPRAPGVRKEDEELLAPEASDEVSLPERRPQDGSDGSEHIVASSVPKRVVDLLEVIEVEQERPER
jgi:hypothetical protein